ncbi:hypothetical protein [Pusillimonas noertemannii]|uniref:hypothetical protein n=1 Tax=Pusillimonas noertemannii TaxID=305977 RepID=UPI00036E7CDD|nr:hypothetical protein [Pusillimonas noertemannii]
MGIFDVIESHSRAMRVPLFAVTLSAVAKKRTPVLLILHWHSLHRATAMQLSDAQLPLRSVPGSGFCLRSDWEDVAYWDQAMLDAGWRLGAWDVERLTCRPWWRLNAGQAETLACHRAFGFDPSMPQQTLIDPDDGTVSDLVEQASTQGYIRWLFRPRAYGVWQGLPDEDVTLAGDDMRAPPCPIQPMPFDRHKAGRRLYRLGRGAFSWL